MDQARSPIDSLTHANALTLLAWSVHWHESMNLWDYVLDPFLGLWSMISILLAWNQRRREKARSGFLFRAG